MASVGFGENVREYFYGLTTYCNLINIAIPDEYVEHGNVDLLKKEIGIDEESITNVILAEMK